MTTSLIDFLRDSNEATECDYEDLKKAYSVSRPQTVITTSPRLDEMLSGLWDELENGDINRLQF